MEKAKKEVEYLIMKSGISNYRISKATGIAQSTLSDYVKGKTNVGRMPLDNAIKLHNYYLEEMESVDKAKRITLLRKQIKKRPLTMSSRLFV